MATKPHIARNGAATSAPNGQLRAVPSEPAATPTASDDKDTPVSTPVVVWKGDSHGKGAARPKGEAVGNSSVKHTEFALKAFDLAELFKMQMQNVRLAGEVPFAVALSTPEGMSTGGGKQATQHVKLVPEAGGSTIVAGSANQLEKVAELRTHDYLAQLHNQRFKGASLPFTREQYADLLKKMQAFFAGAGLRVVMVDIPRGEVASATVAKPPSHLLPIAVGLALMITSIYFAWRLLTHH